MNKGLPVSPGIVVGSAYCISEIFVNLSTDALQDDEVLPEMARYEAARDLAARDLRAAAKKVTQQSGQEQGAIFKVHESILFDSAFTEKIRDGIVHERLSAQAALQGVLNEYASLFARTKDPYLRERVSDVRDVVVRLSGHLSEVLQPSSELQTGPLILVADELLPSHVITLGNREVAGIVTQSGGQTSHAAILARSRGIPAVSGVAGLLKRVKNNDTLVVDGRDGLVIINPDPETESAYRKLQREFFHLKDQLAENRDKPALSADGERVQLLANINGPADVKAAHAMGADGVGLYRTEYLFLTHSSAPGEKEQSKIYKEIAHHAPNHRATIRTLDLGGDKTIPYLDSRKEANPFMGWRSIRLSFEHPELFATQIRSILQAGEPSDDVKPDVRILFPMITALEEVRKVRTLVRAARKYLLERGHQLGQVPVGLMLEVPAAAVTIDTLLPEVDFVSIGSNDLVQYLMAADRDNPKVSHLCQPLSLAVLRVLQQVITACNRAGKPVTLCGEMAGSPRGFVLLYGMGLRSFSMSPAFIPTVKDLLSRLTTKRAEKILQHALQLKTNRRLSGYMAKELAEIAPNLKLLDTK